MPHTERNYPMIILSPEIIEIIGEQFCTDFIKQLETCKKESDHYIWDGNKIFYEIHGNNIYIQSIGEQKKEKARNDINKQISFSYHFYDSIRERFPYFRNSTEEGIRNVIYACFLRTAIKIGGQYNNTNVMYKLIYKMKGKNTEYCMYIPCIETANKIILKTALTEEMGLNNLSQVNLKVHNKIRKQDIIK
jgi:hypothetical protein